MPNIRSLSIGAGGMMSLVQTNGTQRNYDLSSYNTNWTNAQIESAAKTAIEGHLTGHTAFIHIYDRATFDIAILIQSPGVAAPPADWWVR